MHSTAPSTAAPIMSPVNADGWPDERNELKRDEIALNQQHRRPRDRKLRLADVKAMFLEMRDQ